MVTTSHPLAAQVGLPIMRSGGNAIDAAVATAAMLNLVEPSSTGVAAVSGMPQRGILSVTVPGSAWGWDVVLHRFGTESQPAIDYQERLISGLRAGAAAVAIAPDRTIPRTAKPLGGER